MTETEHSLFAKLSAAIFYGAASFFIIVANKVVLTSYGFPSYQILGAAQMFTCIIVLYVAKLLEIVEFQDFSFSLYKKIWPLPLLYLGNVLFGLGGTQKLSLPMYTVLRRFSVLFTMMAEYWLLGVKASKAVQLIVYFMIVGAVVAGIFDLSFDMMGYIMITLTNILTATSMVYTKLKLDSTKIKIYGLLYYNSLFVFLPTLAISALSGDFPKVLHFEHWGNLMFLLHFGLSCILGLLVNYTTFLCTHTNSALTTTIIGVFKNLLVTYIGLVLGGDYQFSWPNFIGLNISVLGSLVYTYLTFTKPGPTLTFVVPPQKAVEQV